VNASFWGGVLVGVLGAFGMSFTAAMLLGVVLRRMDMAELRTWTDEDDDLRMLLADANGQEL
jgi:hypothetical protein